MEKSDCIWAESVVLFIIVVIAGLVSKWMDIMKYQETWARHSLLVHEMESKSLNISMVLSNIGKIVIKIRYSLET